MRQCMHDPVEYFSEASRKEFEDREYLEELAYAHTDRQAAALVAPLGLAVSGGIRVLRATGEQALATTTEFGNNLRRYLKAEYRIAARNIITDCDYIPTFPFDSRFLLRSLIQGPNGKRAVDHMRQRLIQETLMESNRRLLLKSLNDR